MVKVLVGKSKAGGFEGYWAEFEGEKLGSYEDDKGCVYTLYKCTAYENSWGAYRVYISDETDPKAPTYRLLPYDEQSGHYKQPYTNQEVAAEYPLFIKRTDGLSTYYIDPT